MFLWQGTFHEFPFQLINCIDVWSGYCICFLFFSKAFSGYSLMGRCQGYCDDRTVSSISTRTSSFPFVQPFMLMEDSLHQTYYRSFLPSPSSWRVFIHTCNILYLMVIAGKNRPTVLNQKVWLWKKWRSKMLRTIASKSASSKSLRCIISPHAVAPSMAPSDAYRRMPTSTTY